MGDVTKPSPELKRACETRALLNIWRRHRTSKDESMLAFAEWTMTHRAIIADELAPEMAAVLATAPEGSDAEKVYHLCATALASSLPAVRKKSPRTKSRRAGPVGDPPKGA